MDSKQRFSANFSPESHRPPTSPAGNPSPSLSSSPKRWRNFHTTNHKPSRSSLVNLLEGQDSDPNPEVDEITESKRVGSGNEHWVIDQLTGEPPLAYGGVIGKNWSDLRLLLGVMAAPLAPVYVCTADPLPRRVEMSPAQYIVEQYIAACGGQRVLSVVKNAVAIGKTKMVTSEFGTATTVVKNRDAVKDAEPGGFAVWRMNPDMWYVEVSVGGIKVHAGCNGEIVWRHTPWLGGHTVIGPVRPLRRALQGLDPRRIANLFVDSICIGEKVINGEGCFILKVVVDPETLKATSAAPGEIIRHVVFGYFSQRTGLVVYIEDSHLTCIKSDNGDVVYWETSTSSFMDNYYPVEGIMIAHSGHSLVTLSRLAEKAMSYIKTKMEEAWIIEEVAFNVSGLSPKHFTLPPELHNTE